MALSASLEGSLNQNSIIVPRLELHLMLFFASQSPDKMTEQVKLSGSLHGHGGTTALQSALLNLISSMLSRLGHTDRDNPRGSRDVPVRFPRFAALIPIVVVF